MLNYSCVCCWFGQNKSRIQLANFIFLDFEVMFTRQEYLDTLGRCVYYSSTYLIFLIWFLVTASLELEQLSR